MSSRRDVLYLMLETEFNDVQASRLDQLDAWENYLLSVQEYFLEFIFGDLPSLFSEKRKHKL